MKRYGPLHAVSDGLVVGDPSRNHVLLDVDGVHACNDNETLRLIEWDGVLDVSLELPTSQFRFPGAFAGLWSSLLAMLTQGDPQLDLKPGMLSVRTATEEMSFQIDRHHPGGYWKPIVVATQVFLRKVVENPDVRELLREPSAVMHSIIAFARRRGR